MRPKLSFANVVSVLALFVALGGSAYAFQLGKNTVGPKQLKKSAVTAAKIKNGAVTGSKIQLNSLGAVPSATHAATAGDAATLQGNDAGAFLHGNGEILTARRELQIGDEAQMLAMPGLGVLTVACRMGTTFPAADFSFNNRSGGIVDQTLEYDGGIDGTSVPNGKEVSSGGEGLVAIRMKVATRTSPATVATLDLSKAGQAPAPCGVFAQVIVSHG
jgi:hypothetical protein